jgi:NitT/TauT family transport system permease protein
MAPMSENIEKGLKEYQRVQKAGTIKYMLLQIAGIIGFLGIWQLAVVSGVIDAARLPSPVTVFKTLIVKTYSEQPDGNVLLVNILASLQVALTGFLTAIVIGIPLGLIMGWWTKADRFIRPIFELIRPIPPIAWIPLIVVWMGIGLKAKAMIIFFTTFVPCVINSYTGIKLTNQTLINVSKTFGASNLEIFFKVGIQSALPMTFAGIRVALGNSWSTLVAAEMLASSAGLGYMIQIGRSVARPDIVIVGMVVIGVIGALLSALLSFAEGKLMRWQKHRR